MNKCEITENDRYHALLEQILTKKLCQTSENILLTRKQYLCNVTS